MSLNKIDVEVTPESEAEVIQHVRDGRALLDFLIGLSKKEKRRLPKLGSSYVDFVDKTRVHSQQFPEFLPQRVTLEMFLRDLNACDSLERVSAEVKSFDKDLDDTITLLKSEYYKTARLYYKAVQNAASEGDKDAERIAKDLSAHYRKKTSEPKTPAVTPDTPVDQDPPVTPDTPVTPG